MKLLISEDADAKNSMRAGDGKLLYCNWWPYNIIIVVWYAQPINEMKMNATLVD
jgi:hypothetical protein